MLLERFTVDTVVISPAGDHPRVAVEVRCTTCGVTSVFADGPDCALLSDLTQWAGEHSCARLCVTGAFGNSPGFAE